MSKKNVLLPYQNIVNGDMSADITSSVTNIQWLDNVFIELDWTGTPTGTFSVEVSGSYQQDSMGNVMNVGIWNAITLPITPMATGSSGSYALDLNQLSAPWIRVVYTAASGTGTLNSYITSKAV